MPYRYAILYYLSYYHTNITNTIICIIRSSHVNKIENIYKYIIFRKCRISILISNHIQYYDTRYENNEIPIA